MRTGLIRMNAASCRTNAAIIRPNRAGILPNARAKQQTQLVILPRNLSWRTNAGLIRSFPEVIRSNPGVIRSFPRAIRSNAGPIRSNPGTIRTGLFGRFRVLARGHDNLDLPWPRRLHRFELKVESVQ